MKNIIFFLGLAVFDGVLVGGEPHGVLATRDTERRPVPGALYRGVDLPYLLAILVSIAVIMIFRHI